MSKLPKHIRHWDDERAIGHSIIVTLQYGYCFDDGEHVRGFDTVSEARWECALKRLASCSCEECLKGADKANSNRQLVSPNNI